MANLRMIVSGPDRHAAADRLALAAAPGEQGEAIRRSPAPSRAGSDDKVVDPVSVAALVLSIPGALLAVADLADRLRKRKKASAMVDVAIGVRAEGGARIDLVLPDGTSLALDRMTADELLELAKD